MTKYKLPIAKKTFDKNKDLFRSQNSDPNKTTLPISEKEIEEIFDFFNTIEDAERLGKIIWNDVDLEGEENGMPFDKIKEIKNELKKILN